MSFVRALATLSVAVLSVSTSVHAQRRAAEIPRPRLAASADTNDAVAYLSYGSGILATRPEDAANAFYWASRLDPSSENALHGRRVALLMRTTRDLDDYMTLNRRARESEEFRAIDSLQLRALQLNPLMYRSFDWTMLMTWYYNSHRRAGGNMTRRDFEREILYEISGFPPASRAYMLYGMGNFDEAAAEYEAAIRRVRNPVSLRIERARTLALRNRNDEAIAEFGRALQALRERDERRGEYVVFYDSKALIEHSIGVLHVRRDDLDAARAAFGRAMTEDLAYYPPHVELGKLALAAHDTATAVSEYGLAAEIATEEPYIQYLYGHALVSTGQFAEAIPVLERARTLEPLYAVVHLDLGVSLANTGDATGAREAFTTFLALAPVKDAAGRAEAQRWLETLR